MGDTDRVVTCPTCNGTGVVIQIAPDPFPCTCHSIYPWHDPTCPRHLFPLAGLPAVAGADDLPHSSPQSNDRGERKRT